MIRTPPPSPRALGALSTTPAKAPPLLEPAQAPWIRPGAVVHQPEAAVDDLLTAFAHEIRQRGFQVAGYVQRNHPQADLGQDGPEPVELTDLASGRVMTVPRGDSRAMAAAVGSLRGAMRDEADLVVIGRFSAFRKAASAMTAAMSDGITRGMPVLTSIGSPCVEKWQAFAGAGAALLPPDAAALWQWWGPDRLYRDLTLGVADDEVWRVACGPRWLMVQGPHGTGLAYLPGGPKDPHGRLRRAERMSLGQLAGLSRSWDPLEMALGIAAINAHYNRPAPDLRLDNGARALAGQAGRVVVIGAFPGLSEIFPTPLVIEAAPRHGEYPTIAMDSLLPGCAVAVVTSSTLINRTLPRVLRLAQGARVALIGAATPLTPRLFAYGVEVAGGLLVEQPDALAAAIRAGAPPRDFARFGRWVHRRAGP